MAREAWTESLKSPAHVMKVWDATSPEEKKVLLSTVIKKVSSQTAGEEQQHLLEQLLEYVDNHPN